MKSKKKAQKKTSAKKSATNVAVAMPAPIPAPMATLESASVASAMEEPEAPPAAASERRPVSMEERRRLIRIAAYHRAERIGFGVTDPVEDWLVAEREIDAMLTHGVTI